MYLSFYHLTENPFQISTNPRFLWLGPKHEEGLATLKYGVLDKKGFLLLTGDVGTGKTTLVNALLNMLEENTLVALVRDPNLEPLDFFNYIAHAFHMDREFHRKSSFLIYFEQFLNEAHAAGKTVLLIIDEAQRISQELLEEVRLLSNIERHDCKLLNIFFVGQIEFNDILLRPENRAIRQRITVNYTIPALTEEETGLYIRHRLKVAGATGEKQDQPHMQQAGTIESAGHDSRPYGAVENIFTREAIREIFSFSGGCPRLINIICDRCLLTGFVEDSPTITPEIVRECRQELKIPESEPGRTVNQPAMRDNIPPFAPLESGRENGENRVEAADENRRIPEPESSRPLSGSQRLEKKRTTFIVRMMLFLGILFIGLIVGYTNLSQNDDQALLTNQIMKYTEDSGPTTSGAASSPGAEKISSPPGKQVEVFPSEREAPPQHTSSFTAKNTGEQERVVPGEGAKADPEIAPTAPLQTTADSVQARASAVVEKLTVPFPSDSNYPPNTSLDELNRLAENLLRQPQLALLITGYSDSLGDEQYNVKLSEFRANTVKSYLVGRGLPASRITVQGRGSQNPIAPNDSVSGRSANRRVEIEIVHPGDE